MNMQVTSEDRTNGYKVKPTFTVNVCTVFEARTGELYARIVRLTKQDLDHVISKNEDKWRNLDLCWCITTETRVRA